MTLTQSKFFKEGRRIWVVKRFWSFQNFIRVSDQNWSSGNGISACCLTHKAIQSNTENWKCKSIKFMLDLETTKGINQINANLKWHILMQRFSLSKIIIVNREMDNP